MQDGPYDASIRNIRADIDEMKADLTELAAAADGTWSGCAAAFAVYDTKLARIEERIDMLTEAYKSVVELVKAFAPEEL